MVIVKKDEIADGARIRCDKQTVIYKLDLKEVIFETEQQSINNMNK